MALMVPENIKKSAIYAAAAIVVSFAVILMGAGILDESPGAQSGQTPQDDALADVQKPAVEKVSDELNTLKSKGWGELAEKLGRPRAAAVLWYHLKATYNVDVKVVFGSPKKLDCVLAIQESAGGESSLPKVSIKGINYYLIDPMTPAFIGEFKYGDMFDDPGNTYLSYSYFRIGPEDIDIIEQWIKETGVNLKYTDFPGK